MFLFVTGPLMRSAANVLGWFFRVSAESDMSESVCWRVDMYRSFKRSRAPPMWSRQTSSGAQRKFSPLYPDVSLSNNPLRRERGF